MIKVIKHGKKQEKQIECSTCGCIFAYGLEDCVHDDLGYPYVVCPECGRLLLTSLRKKETDDAQIFWTNLKAKRLRRKQR